MKNKKRKKSNQHVETAGSAEPREPGAGGAPAHRTVRDGAVELAMAVASLTALVRVDASRDPFMTNPADLFERTFSNVGLDDNQMELLREELRLSLPCIAGDLAAHAADLDRAGLRIGSYAAFLHAALRAASYGD
ncbi:MAG: hypothetical protein IT164_07080 [Bryobacterales bacterium]|nr:hypothetical protein [Bryobacterales bacterium]